MTPRQNQGTGKRRAPAVPLEYYDSKFEARNTNLFFVFYGGKVTEDHYLKELSDDLAGTGKRTKSQFIRLQFVNGTPEQIVESASSEVKDRQQEGTENANEEKDIIWVVFDKDDFGNNYSTAIHLARQKGIHVAYSNECFELWLLLHFQVQEAAIRRAKLTDFLRKKWEEIVDITIESKKQVKHFPYGILRTHGSREEAIVRAKLLYGKAETSIPESPWKINPVTTVYQLVEQLIRFFAE